MSNGQQPSQQQVNQAAQQYHVQRGYHGYGTQQQATDQADQRVDAETKNTWFLGPFAPIFKKLAEAQAKIQYNDKLPGEVASLKQGLQMRSAPEFQAANYDAYSHESLHQMVTQGVDPGSVGEMGDTWLKIGNGLTSFQNTIATTLAKSETSWQGVSGDRARQAVAALGNRGAQAGQAAQLAGVVTHQQSQALATAKNSMPPPPSKPFDPAAAQQQLQTITDPIAFATQAAADQKAFTQQKAAQQQAAQVVREYDTTVAQTSQHLPAFAPAPPVAKPAPVPTPPVGPTPPIGGRPTPRRGDVTPHVVPGTGSNDTPGQWSRQGSPGSTPPSSVQQPGNPGQTSTSDYVNPGQFGNGPGGTGPYGNGPYGGGPAGGSGSPVDAFGGGMIGPVGGGGSLAGLGDDALRSGSGFGPGGSGGAGAGGGPRVGGAAGDGGGAGGGRSGAGGQAGARSGAGAAAAEEAAVQRGAAGARGTAGAGGMAPGARGSKGGEDAEHKRPSYLQEPDPNDIFGSDEKTVPPVIG